MKKILLLSSVLFILITACGSADASLPATPATTPTPSPAPSSTPSPTETATSAPAKFTSTLVGVSEDFAKKLGEQGINESLNEDGTIKSVTVGYNPDGTDIVEEDVKIVASGINFQTDFQGNILKDANGKPISQDIHNLGYVNGIATVVDGQGRVLHWNETGKEWVASLSVNTDRASGSFYPPGRQDLILETILLNPELNKVFADDSDAVINFAGYSIFFEYNKATDSSHAQLQPRNLNQIEIVRGPDGNPLIWKTIKEGIVSKSLSLRFLNPADSKKVSGKETIILTGDPGVLIGNDENGRHGDYGALLENFFLPEAGGWDGVLPLIQLASRGNYFEKVGVPPFGPVSSLDSLFSQPGNDPGELPLFAYPINDAYNRVGLGKDNPIMAWGFGETESLPSEMQKILFALSFAAK